jgi:hypothetical protein
MRVRENLVASARRHLPCLAFACTRMRGDTMEKVRYVEDSMRVRANLVASARRHLPCLAFACTRMRGDTIVSPESMVSPESTHIGVHKKGSHQNQLRFPSRGGARKPIFTLFFDFKSLEGRIQWGRTAAGMETVRALPGVPSDSANM